MMKGGKIEEKLMVPLFPKLHINDAEKGGPRPPPRNKMALCEHLSLPSHRFASGSPSTLSLPMPNATCNLPPSTSVTHVTEPEMSLCSPFCNSTVSPHLADKLPPYSSGGANFKTALPNLERKPEKPTNDPILSSTPKCSSIQRQTSLNPFVRKLGNKDHFRVLGSGQLGITFNCSNSWKNTDKEKLVSSSPNCPKNLQISCERQKQFTSIRDLDLRPRLKQFGKNHGSVLLNGDKVAVNASSSPLDRDRISEQANGGHASLNLKNSCNWVNDSKAQFHHEGKLLQEMKTENRNGPMSGGLSCPRPSTLGDHHRISNRIENGSEFHEDWQSWSSRAGNVDRNNDVSDTSMVDSISSLDISPDDVVRLIGQKQFWKARRAIVHQQRTFAAQVFELHRLIKVQRLIARSPDLFIKNNLYLGTTASMEESPAKKFRSEYVVEPPPSIVKKEDDSQKPNPSDESTVEKAVGNPCHPPNSDTSKICITQQSNCELYSRNAAPVSVASNAKPPPWCPPPPPGNQWLVPVISPSEGLVYKPYAGPCPPTAGFMAPVYGSYGAMSLAPESSNFLNEAHGIPFPHQQGILTLPVTPPLGQPYFPPFGMPLMKPSVSRSPVEQTNPFPRAEPKGQDSQLCIGDVNIIPYRSSFNIASQKTGMILYSVSKLQASKGNELQGSRPSSPEVEKGDPLPLFPTSPQFQALDQGTRVIKVVPHNPIAAFESAARIFQSIQEERKIV